MTDGITLRLLVLHQAAAHHVLPLGWLRSQLHVAVVVHGGVSSGDHVPEDDVGGVVALHLVLKLLHFEP